VQVTADGFAPAGTDQGFTLMTRENVAPGVAFNVSLSGSAPAQAPGQPSAGGQQPQGRDSNAAPAGENVQVLSPRLNSFQWIILGGMGLFFLAGFFFLTRQPRALSVTPDGAMLSSAPVGPAPRKSRPRDVAAPVSPAPAATLDEADRGVRMSMDELKDTLFRLELRHQAGTINDQDYAGERARLEAVLRDYVRG
ncbi:MAG TPA: hypothetical protein VKG84_01745, partial [Candidatus Acidoferrales bacterium]|nr:hypothetical protein [Candidatus Acidoferrales bacterium]